MANGEKSAELSNLSLVDSIREFAAQLKKTGKIDKPDHLSDDKWSRIRSAILGVLGAFDFPVELKGRSIELPVAEPKAFESEFFRPFDDLLAKDQIGMLVSYFLRYVSDRNVLLGSGSTVFHVGRNMIKLVEKHPRLRRFRQLFWTVNLALAAELSTTKSDVISRVSIPEGQLRTMTFRFSQIRPPSWYCPIVVVGADGCYFDSPDRNTLNANLYANEAAVAANTNLFIDKAVDSVICCLASRKIAYEQGEGQNAGPHITMPVQAKEKEGVNWYLVTDKEPGDRERKALEKANWKIVTKLEDWVGGNGEIRNLGRPFWKESWFKDAR